MGEGPVEAAVGDACADPLVDWSSGVESAVAEGEPKLGVGEAEGEGALTGAGEGGDLRRG